MKTFSLCLSQVGFLLFLSTISLAQSQEYKFVKDYIKTLVYRYELEKIAESEISKVQDDFTQLNLASMRSAQRGILKLRESISLLSPYKKSNSKYICEANETVITSYQDLIDNNNSALNALEEIINATPSSDMGKLSRKVSEITTDQDYISETLLKTTAFIVMLMVDEKPDENNKCSFLLITSKERKALLKELESFFPKSVLKSKDKNPKYTVASAIILNTILTGDHKSSDERIK